jgi:hypothetical protein
MWLVSFDIYDKPTMRAYKHDLELVLLSSLGDGHPTMIVS